MIAALRCKPSATDVGGPDMAPHTPQRSERPGKPVALLDHGPSARTAPGNPWRSSITGPAFGAPRETRGAPRRSGRKVAEHAARTAAVGDDAALVDRAHAVHPHAVHADAGRVEPLGARRQILYAALLAPRDGGRIEQQEVGPCAGHEPAAVRDAVRGGDVARHPLDRLGQREITALAHPVAEQVQAEARVAEERE